MTVCVNVRDLSFRSFLFVLIVYPYLFLLNIILPGMLPGDNCLYIYGITALLFAVFLLRWNLIRHTIPAWVLSLFLFITVNIVLLNLLYNSRIKHIEVLRIPYTLVVYLGVAYCCTRDIDEKKSVYTIILYACIMQALIGIIHYFCFPYIKTGMGGSGAPYAIDLNDPSPQAERGLLLNPNVYSLFLLLGSFLLVFRDKAFAKKWMWETAALILMIAAIVLSNSRFGLVFGMILFAFYFARSGKRGKAILAGLAVICVIASAGFLRQRISHAYHRTFLRADGYGGHYLSRTTRNMNALELLTSDWSSVLLGPSQEKTVEFKEVQGKKYSDNSFFLLFHNFGLPAAFIIICAMALLYGSVIDLRKRGVLLFLLYFTAALFIYNSILFDIWLFFFSASLMVLGGKSGRGETQVPHES